jgi:hypothetical protein
VDMHFRNVCVRAATPADQTITSGNVARRLDEPPVEVSYSPLIKIMLTL